MSTSDTAYYFYKSLSFLDIINQNGEGGIIKKLAKVPEKSAEMFRLADVAQAHLVAIQVGKLFNEDVIVADLSSTNVERVYWGFKALYLYNEVKNWS